MGRGVGTQQYSTIQLIVRGGGARGANRVTPHELALVRDGPAPTTLLAPEAQRFGLERGGVGNAPTSIEGTERRLVISPREGGCDPFGRGLGGSCSRWGIAERRVWGVF